MAASSIRLKAKSRDGMTTVRAIIQHPMETGFRVDPESGERLPAHYIKLLEVKHNEKRIISCDWSRAVSKNPYFSFKFKGAHVGDKLSLSWIDNKNNTDKIETTIE